MGATFAMLIAGTQSAAKSFGSAGLLDVTTGLQTGLGFASHEQQAQAASLRGRFENDVAERNAQLSEKEGEDALNVGNLEENRQRLATEQEQGASLAAQGASGATVGSGSNADVRASQQLIGDVDALTIRNNAARQAWGYDVEAANSRMQGKLALLAGENEAASQRTAAVTTLLGGAYSLYSASKLRVKPDTTTLPPLTPPMDPATATRMVQQNPYWQTT